MGGSGGTLKILGLSILVILGGFFFYSIWRDKKRKASGEYHEKKEKGMINKEKRKAPESVQDLFDYENISDKGITKLNNGTYTATMELIQINQHLNNDVENSAIWKKFRTMLNSISIRQTMLVQSQYLDVMDFVNDYNTQSEVVPNLTPELHEARADVIKNYKEFAEEKTREYRAYIIFRFNPKKEGIDKGLETGNAIIDNLISAAKGQANDMDEDEEKELAEQVLEEVIDLSYQLLYSIGCQAIRLNRSGVLALTYSTLNRDLTTSQRIHDISDAHGFSEFKQSLTPYYYENKINEENMKPSLSDYAFDESIVVDGPEDSVINLEKDKEEELYQLQ